MNFRWPSTPNSEAVKLTLVAVTASVVTLSAVELFRLAQARKRREELGRRARKDVYGLEDGNRPDDEQSALDVVENAARALDDYLQEKTGNTTYDEGLIREQLSRNYSFFGEEAMSKVRKGRVVVVGCGGVGSWAAVMLVRSGVSSLRLIDFDMVTLSSLNRHAVAELADVGTPKVLACKKFFERVAPWAEIDARQELWQPGEHGESLLGGDVDWVIDAIDNIATKVELLKYCRKRGIKVFASMGAGAKCDPTRVQISDISNTYEDPLARSVRRGLRQDGIIDGIPVVYSTEVPGDVKLLPLPENEVSKGAVHELGPFDNFRVRILPVLGPLPSIFGLHIATYIICELAGKPILNPLANRNRKKLYEKLLRDLTAREAKVSGNNGVPERLSIDENDIAFIFEDLHRGRTIVPPHLIPQRPLLTRWDVTKPLSVENCVVLAQEDIKRLDAAGGRGADVPEWSHATPGDVVTAIVEKRIEEARAWLRAVVVCRGTYLSVPPPPAFLALPRHRNMSDAQTSDSIKPIDRASVHRITSGQVVIDLQGAVKELVENSLDAGATNIEVRFKDHGVKSLEVIDNGSGISKENYEGLALKHHTSKLSNFEDLTIVRSFGFRGEALSSICALSESVVFTTATASEAPMGTVLEMERSGKLKSSEGKVARQRGTTVTVTSLFAPLPVRRKEFERNAKREFGKALNLLQAYALVPCVQENQGVRLTVFNQMGSGKKTSVLQTDGSRSLKSSVSSLWGPKQVESLVPLDLICVVQTDKASLKRQGILEEQKTEVRVTGLISKFSPGNGRASSDRQFFYVNGRPCNLTKIQKAFNEVYRSFNTNQSPFIIADFQLPTASCDINVSPDKRTIFIHSEGNLILVLKEALEHTFSSARSTYTVQETESQKQSSRRSVGRKPIDVEEDDFDPLAGDDTSANPVIDEPKSIPVDRKPEPIDSVPSSSTRSHREPSRGRKAQQAVDEPDTGTAENERAPSKKPLFHPSPEPEDTPEPSSRPAHLNSETQRRPSRPPLTQLSRNASSDPDEPSPEPTAEFLHVVSPVGTKRTYTTAASSRAAVASDTASTGGRPVQTILSTVGASWNLRRGREPTSPESRKKARTSKDLVQKTLDFKTRLTSFARPGSQVDSQPTSQTQSEQSEEVDDEMEMAEVQELTEVDQEMDVFDETLLESRVERIPLPIRSRRVLSPEAESPERSEPPTRPFGRRRSSSTRSEIEIDSVEVEVVGSHPKGLKEKPDTVPVESPGKDVKQTANRSDSRGVKLEMERISRLWNSSNTGPSAQGMAPSAMVSGAASVSNVESQQKAEEELSRVIQKADFESMEVLGQFNKGFIIARLRKAPDGETGGISTTSTDDLFLIDQHASDEKYNFETLQTTTKIQSQQLIQPRLLELSAADELVAAENTDILRKNGFEIVLKPAAPGERDRVHLVAQPVSKRTVFDFKDLEELLHLMQNAPTGQMVRCSKARNMFASRACRKSVMIGDPLTIGQMTSASCEGGSTHGNHGSTLELPTRTSDNATLGPSTLRAGQGTLEH